ncbi:MAG: YgiQ family radical SAM protein [Alistipes sp.]|nr:YgiQ family radical SAM protein [Candidatus Alistipes equi]
MGFLPTSLKEVQALGWSEIDIILFSSDAYVDHPSFAASVVGRILEDEGLRIAIVPQPNWRDDLRDFRKLGKPRLCFAVSGGAMDSMVNHYTASKRLRHNDAYTAGGRSGFRPDYAVTVYTNILKKLYPDVPVIIGGIEASLRRLTHYDYWQDKLLPSILSSSGADFLFYGMGERVLREFARVSKNSFNPHRIKALHQVAYIEKKNAYRQKEDDIMLHSYEQCLKDKRAFGENFVVLETQCNLFEPKSRLIEPVSDSVVIVNPMYSTISSEDLDSAFDLPYMRAPHPRYSSRGEIPAWSMICNSVNIHRGCFGGCSFCTISAHQGKFISSRSERSILREIDLITQSDTFHGTLSDVGGPSANMYRIGGRNTELCQKCRRPSCLFPTKCRNLDADSTALLSLYRAISQKTKVKHMYIGSGIRYDLFDGEEYLREVTLKHTSGRLKVAPEHTEDDVLRLMRKPPFKMFEKTKELFDGICQKAGLPYQIVPYFISSHPGCSVEHMRLLHKKVLSSMHMTLEQVQDFTPTPMTLSSVMFYTGENPYTHEKVYVARSLKEKEAQKNLFFRHR